MSLGDVVNQPSTAATATAVDAIIVPGGGSQRGATSDTLPPWTIRRLDRAAFRFHNQLASSSSPNNGAPVIIVLSAGTPHRPNYINDSGWPVLEATSAAYYLMSRHRIPPHCIRRETTSLDTIGNAYFCRVQHVEPNALRWHKLLVITSDFHMARTRRVFDFVFGLPPTTAATPFEMLYESVGDEGIDVSLRSEREKRSLEGFESLLRDRFGSEDKRTMQGLCDFIFCEHTAYSTHDKMTPSTNVAAMPREVLDTY